MTIMTEGATTSLRSPAAKLAGFLYLIVIACGLFAVGFVHGSLIVPSDAGATADNIVASEALYRLGFAAQVVMYVCYVAVTVILYELFKPVDRSASLLAMFFSLAGIAIGAVSALNAAAPWFLLRHADYLDVFATGQLQALAYVFLRLDSAGFSVSGVFFGIYMVVIGSLIAGSSFLPRILGVLMAIGGMSDLIDSIATFLSPPLADELSPYIALPGFIGELFLSLWLFLVGVNGLKWQAQAGAMEG